MVMSLMTKYTVVIRHELVAEVGDCQDHLFFWKKVNGVF